MNTLGSEKKRAQLEMLENRKPLWFVFVHDHWFSRTWTYFMHILLIYTAFNIPLNVAFPQTSSFLQGLDVFIDYCFIIDMFMNFIIGYENEDRNPEFRLKKIAIRYISSWFFVDLIANLPMEKIVIKLNNNSVTSVGANVTS